jgi:PAS domain S-box-containing protein
MSADVPGLPGGAAESGEAARLRAENEQLRAQLLEAEDTLAAIRGGEVDALVVGSQVYTLESADASSNRLRKDVLAQMEDAVVACDDEGHLIYLNPAAEARYGTSSSAALGRVWTELFEERWPSGEERARAADDLARTGVSRSHTVQRTPGGVRIHAETTTSRLRDADGTPIGTLSVIRDVTERERIEAALRESRAHLRFMLDSAGVGDWDLDLATLEVRHSLRHDQCFGYSEPVPDWNPERFFAHVHVEDREAIRERFKTVLETGSDWHFECRVVWPDSSIHWIEVHGAIYRSGLTPARMLGTIVDITSRKSVEEALRSADRSKDEFLATLAHELRNPLAPIRNALEIMRLTQEPQTLESARHIIERQLKQMIHLVDDLLDISRITQGKIELRPERVDLFTVLQNAVETSRPLVEARRQELTLKLPPAESLTVRADATRLVQVIANLLNNAAKYTAEGGRIVLAAWRDAGHAVVVVEDTGIGIPPTMLPRVFDMFAQVDRGIERAQGGLGIGLALVKRLVEMHGGSVHAESKGENRGSRFTIRLPTIAAASGAAHSRPIPAEALPHFGTRVLVVDDNVDSASSLATMFELLGCRTAVAHDGLSAVREAETFVPDMAVLDIGLPGISGHEAARRIRQLPAGRAMLLVAVSGWGQDADRQRSVEAGFDHHLVKPVDMEALQAMLPHRVASSNVHRIDRGPR